MANVKISDLTEKTSIAAGDWIEIEDVAGNASKKVRADNILPPAGAGPVNIANPYTFRAYRNTAANTSAGSFAKVTFDTENFDQNSNFASGTYTAPVDGVYHFDAAIQLATSSSSGLIALYKNGSEYSRGARGKANADLLGLTVGDDILLDAGDTVEVYVFCSSTLALDIIASTNNYFSGHLINQLQ